MSESGAKAPPAGAACSAGAAGAACSLTVTIVGSSSLTTFAHHLATRSATSASQGL